MATVYAVASAKGGVGKTTTAANLAAILSVAGEDTVVVDADLGMANLAGALGVDAAEPTLHDVLAGEADPEDAVREGPSGLRVIPGETDLDAYAGADPARLREVIEAFADADVVLLDCGAGLAHDSALPLVLADETLLVSTPERDALIDTDKTADLAARLGGTVAGAALTRVTADNHDEALVDELLDAPVLGQIPEDPTVGEALRAGEPLATFAPDAPATAAYRALAAELTGATLEPAPGAEEEAKTDEAEADDAETDETEQDDEETEDSEPDETEQDDGETEDSEPDETEQDDAETGDAETDDAETDDAETDDAETDESSETPSEEDESDRDDPPIAEAEPDRSDSDAADPARADPDAPEPAPVHESAEPEEDADGDTDEDDLEDSIPFRDADDDVDGGAEDDADGADTDGSSGADADDEGSDDANNADDTDDGTDEKKGFFARLFGR